MKVDVIRPESFSSVLIESIGDEGKGEYPFATGTGFFYKPYADLDDVVLVTNWHIVTGRNPSDPARLMGPGISSPKYLDIWMPTLAEPARFVPVRMNLYGPENQPVWLEYQGFDYIVDVVAITGNLPASAKIVPVPTVTIGTDPLIGIGDDVFTIGFPYGGQGGTPLPVWKKASIASEPSTLISGELRYFIDTPGRPGMSGSPIYVAQKGMRFLPGALRQFNDVSLSALERVTSINEKDFLGETNILQLIGVYAGSYGDRSIGDMHLGFGWNAVVLDMLFKDPKFGQNPFPPFD